MPDVINMFFKWFWRFIARFKWEGITLLAYALATVVSISAAEAAEQAATDQVTARLIAETPALHQFLMHDGNLPCRPAKADKPQL